MTTRNGQSGGATNGSHATNGEMSESLVLGHTNHGLQIHAALRHLTRFLAVFEVYDPALALRTSEVLEEFKIVIRDRTIYSGRAVVRSLIATGLTVVCEVTLDENFWKPVDLSSAAMGNGRLSEEFGSFLREWQKLYKILPEYKLVIADMHTFLSDLRLWLDQVEVGIRSLPAADRASMEEDAVEELARPILPCISELFEQFELIVEKLEADLRPTHQNYMRRQLHPLVLSAPFASRSFNKPLGYAGDYEIVNMIVRNGHEGESLFAKIVNTWFLRQPPAQAHRNRIQYLADMLAVETARLIQTGRPARMLDVACGPAQEVQRFLAQSPLCELTTITLLDFNEETLKYVHATMDSLKRRHCRNTPLDYVKQSVHSMLKETGRPAARPAANLYDCIYCAGLFDYLPDQVCHRLMDIWYTWLAPGGLLVATNVEPSNPLRNGMDHLLDWPLIYRTGSQFRKLIPERAPAGTGVVHSDSTGVNIFLEIRKPANGQ